MIRSLPLAVLTRLCVDNLSAVAQRITEFAAAGVDLLLLQCSPQMEEMERFAETVIRPCAMATAA